MHQIARRARAALAVVAFAPLAAVAATVPLNVTFEIDEQVAPGTTPACALNGYIAGSGTQKTLGELALQSVDCINPLPIAGTFAFLSTNVVLTTASGDKINAAYAGVLGADGTVTGVYAIRGGTGRYANAKGTGTLSGYELIDPATGAGTGEIALRGKLTY